jgi:hypothetical protein
MAKRARKWVVRCAKRCKGFAIRAGITCLAVFAVLIVLANTGEAITVGVAFERLAEALGYATADTLAE